VPFGVWFDPEKQSPRAFALLTYLARNPAPIKAVRAFVKGIGHSRHRLTEYLMELISEV
jgi:hypothetical protein